VASKVLLELLEGILDEHFKKINNVVKIKRLKTLKRGRNKKRKNVFTSTP